MIRRLPLVAALAVIAGAGVANGLWNDRWGVSHELADMTARLPKVPEEIGRWRIVEKTPEMKQSEQKLNDKLVREGYLHALVSRTYRSDKGEIVAVLLATGRPGPISTHNPLTCIGASDNMETLSDVIPKPIEVAGHGTVFSRCDFRKLTPIVAGDGISVYWSWHDSKKGWIASNDPRTTFAAQRALTKIYVSRALPIAEMEKAGKEKPGKEKPDAAVQFITECLPTIDKVLFE